MGAVVGHKRQAPRRHHLQRRCLLTRGIQTYGADVSVGHTIPIKTIAGLARLI